MMVMTMTMMMMMMMMMTTTMNNDKVPIMIIASHVRDVFNEIVPDK